MSEWPPKFEDTFIILQSGTPPYWQKIKAELDRQEWFQTVDPAKQYEFEQALFYIDWIASSAARSLRGSPWNREQLFSAAQPGGMVVFKDGKKTHNYRKWARHREHQCCIEFCRCARDALLGGEWGTAVFSALYAGLHGNGAAGITAGTLQPSLHAGRTAAKIRAERNREIILREAAESAPRGEYNVSSIAAEIHENHKDKHGFPRFEAIRKILSEDRSWEIRP